MIIQRQQEAKFERMEGNLIAAVRRCLNAQPGSLFRAALSGGCSSPFAPLSPSMLISRDH